jgi:hypothetical protein
MRKKALKRRIEDLKARNELLDQMIQSLMGAVKPPRGNYAMFIMAFRMTAAETATIDEFWKWAEKQDRSTLTKNALLNAFDMRMPQKLRGQLEQILKEHRKDQTPQFLFYADLVLGKETQISDKRE